MCGTMLGVAVVLMLGVAGRCSCQYPCQRQRGCQCQEACLPPPTGYATAANVSKCGYLCGCLHLQRHVPNLWLIALVLASSCVNVSCACERAACVCETQACVRESTRARERASTRASEHANAE